jgi:hypothetical protein
MQNYIDRSGIATGRCRRPSMGRGSASGAARPDRLSRGCGPSLGRQNDQALVVSATLYETGLFGVPNRLLKVRIRRTDITANAFGSPPRRRAVGTEAVELGDERRRRAQDGLGRSLADGAATARVVPAATAQARHSGRPRKGGGAVYHPAMPTPVTGRCMAPCVEAVNLVLGVYS